MVYSWCCRQHHPIAFTCWYRNTGLLPCGRVSVCCAMSKNHKGKRQARVLYMQEKLSTHCCHDVFSTSSQHIDSACSERFMYLQNCSDKVNKKHGVLVPLFCSFGRYMITSLQAVTSCCAENTTAGSSAICHLHKQTKRRNLHALLIQHILTTCAGISRS